MCKESRSCNRQAQADGELVSAVKSWQTTRVQKKETQNQNKAEKFKKKKRQSIQNSINSKCNVCMVYLPAVCSEQQVARPWQLATSGAYICRHNFSVCCRSNRLLAANEQQLAVSTRRCCMVGTKQGLRLHCLRWCNSAC